MNKLIHNFNKKMNKIINQCFKQARQEVKKNNFDKGDLIQNRANKINNIRTKAFYLTLIIMKHKKLPSFKSMKQEFINKFNKSKRIANGVYDDEIKKEIQIKKVKENSKRPYHWRTTKKERQFRRAIYKQMHKFGTLNYVKDYLADFGSYIDDINKYRTHHLKNNQIIINPYYRCIVIISLTQINDITVNSSKNCLIRINNLIADLFNKKITLNAFEDKINQVPVNPKGARVKRLIVDYFNDILPNIFTCSMIIDNDGNVNYDETINKKMIKKAKKIGKGKDSVNYLFVPLSPLAPDWIKYPIISDYDIKALLSLLKAPLLLIYNITLALLGQSEYKVKSDHKYELKILNNMKEIVKNCNQYNYIDSYDDDYDRVSTFRSYQIALYLDSFWLYNLKEKHYNYLPNPCCFYITQ